MSPEGNFAVSLRAVRKSFASGVDALDGLDVKIWPREFVSFLGPSGCGKSTALRIIAGLSEPTSGRVEWPPAQAAQERSPAQLAPAQLAPAQPATARARSAIGIVFQEPTLMPWSTVARNVRLPLDLQGEAVTEADARVAAALAHVGLAQFAEAYPRELSGGMKMRAAIARALVAEPKLLLMDEPFAALDEITRFKLNDDLLALWRMLGMTVVFVTHSVFESVYLSSRIVVMTARPGRVFTELEVDAPYPRDSNFRTSAEYAAHCRRTSEALAAAAAVGEER